MGLSAYWLISIGLYRRIGLYRLISAYRLIGSVAYRLMGLSAYRLIGLSAYRLIGLQAYRHIGLMAAAPGRQSRVTGVGLLVAAHRLIGLYRLISAYRFISSSAYWLIGVSAYRHICLSTAMPGRQSRAGSQF